MTFERETRYWILKLSDIRQLSPNSMQFLLRIMDELDTVRVNRGKSGLQAVVVESDWDCYEDVWKLVEKECNDKSNTN